MADINEVRQRMMDELEQKIRNDPQLASIRAKIQSGDPNVRVSMLYGAVRSCQV